MARFSAAVFTALSFFCVPAWAAESDQAAQEREMCAVSKCQRDLRVTLRREDGTLYDERFKVFPAIVQGKSIRIMAGQAVHIEADVAGDRLVNMVAVDKVTRPEKTITAKFEQNEQGGMLLTIDNPFSKALKFNMGIMPLESAQLVKTTSCPVGAGIKLFEHWPYPIFMAVLANARLLEKGDTTACVN